MNTVLFVRWFFLFVCINFFCCRPVHILEILFQYVDMFPGSCAIRTFPQCARRRLAGDVANFCLRRREEVGETSATPS